jgi:hypothetical protein
MGKSIRIAMLVLVVAFLGPIAIAYATQYSLILRNKTPGSELVVVIRQPMHVRGSIVPGCKFTVNDGSQAVVSCPKVATFQPGERSFEIEGSGGALCRFGFTDRPDEWDTNVSGSCRMEQTGASSVRITP